MLVFDMAEKTTWNMIGAPELAEMLRSRHEEVSYLAFQTKMKQLP